MEKLILKLTRVKEDGTKEVICNQKMESVAVIGGCFGDNKIMELLANVSVKEVGGMIMQSSKLINAAKIAVLGHTIFKQLAKFDPEQELADQIDGGMQ